MKTFLHDNDTAGDAISVTSDGLLKSIIFSPERNGSGFLKKAEL